MSAFENNLSGWPFQKLDENVSKLSPESQVAVLVTTGALNPIHRGHVWAMEAARKYLESQNHAVVAGWISPSHDLYVQPKMHCMRDRALPASLRVRCAQLATVDSPWLDVGTWESDPQHAVWPDFPQVVRALEDQLRAHLPQAVAGKLSIFYVCGADHLRNVSPAFRYGLIVLQRAPHVVPKDMASRYRNLHVLDASAPDNLSSTKVRALMARGLLSSPMLSPAVEQELALHIPRFCFISASTMVAFWQDLPSHILATSLLFFGSRKCWLFPATPAQEADRDAQPTPYAAFPAPFLQYVRIKLERNEAFFLKPDEPAHQPSYEPVSLWIQSLQDPVTSTNYGPLILDPKWWMSSYDPKRSRLPRPPSAQLVIENIVQGEHDYSATMELLNQSNPNMFPILSKQQLYS